MSSKDSSKKKNILFICTHNSARSQMAEGLVNHLYHESWIAKSAGTKRTFVKPLAIETMNEIGIDISHHESESIEVYKNRMFDVVVTVCDSSFKSQELH